MIRLENTLTGKKEEFKPMKGNTARFYTCGPTVYNFVHIGNLRTYIFEDILRRTLKYNGYKVLQVMNITDIDDKIIKRANAENKDPKEITVPYTEAFISDIKKLNIEKPEKMPKATGHIREMIVLIGKLLKKGYAYKGADGSIYFDITKFDEYGQLGKIDKDNLRSGARIEADEYNKDEVQDFVLWKARKPGEPFWKSPYGEGRPGWHIECSAMSMKYLGESFDIHTGAVDNIFPHHDNEIAQSEAATGKMFAKYWIHGEHLLVGGEKMAKSAGNFYTLRDIEDKGYDPLDFRYLVLNTHYRSKLNFTWESLTAAKSGLTNLIRIYSSIKKDIKKGVKGKISKTAVLKLKDFTEAVSDDLNTSKGLAILWEVLRDESLSSFEKESLADSFDKVLGLGLSKKPSSKAAEIPENVLKLAEEREKARQNKQFGKADEIRGKIELIGYEVKDTPEGPIILKK